MEKQEQKKGKETQKQEKTLCPRCGSKNTYSNPKARFKHLYCNHCGYEE